ncbi:MAG TPA: integrase core domain-containing protein [Mycobacterium sp.]
MKSQTNGVIERFFGTLKYEHLFRGYIGDGDALDMEVHRFRIIYNTIRPHQALADRTPKQAYLEHKNHTKPCQLLHSRQSGYEGTTHPTPRRDSPCRLHCPTACSTCSADPAPASSPR